jgi:sugar lactone lactonase YvrE
MDMPGLIDRRTAMGTLAFATASLVWPLSSVAQDVSTIDSDLSYPEGLLIHNGELYVAEILREQVIVYDLEHFHRQRVIPLTSCGPTSIAPILTDQILITCHMTGRLAIYSLAGDSKANVARTISDQPIPWPNDCTSDGDGGVFLTSSGLFDIRAPATGAVMHVSRSLQAKVMVERLHYANGITYDPVTRELFVTEHFGNRVFVFVLDEFFGIRERRVFFDLHGLPEPNVPPFPQMGPDNLHFRANGDLIVPHYGGGRFLIVSRAGQLRQIVNVPCQFITDAVELGNDMLFIGAFDLSSREPKGILGRVRMV